MFKKLQTSLDLVKMSFKYIKRDGELLTYSIFSLLATVAMLATFIGIDTMYLGSFEKFMNSTEANESTVEILAIAYMFIFYLVFSFITFFFNTAIITSVNRRNNGEDNLLGDGLRDAIKHLKEIFIWSLINATVTTILKVLQNKFGENSIVGRIIFGLIGGLWNILTFFSFPIMILNKKGPKDAIKQSAILFKKTWGERAVIHVGIGLLFFFLYLLVFILVGVFMYLTGMFITGFIIGILSILFLAILSSTCDVIIKTILLYYAENGKLPEGVENGESIMNIAGEKL